MWRSPWTTTAICRDHAGRPIHCSPGFYPAQPDRLYRNRGDGTFTEVSKEAGFVADGGRGLGLAIADLDGDGKLDIFVANDATPNFLFRNRGGFRFDEIGAEAGVATNGSGLATASMGVVADDLDGDGRIDLFITNLVNESSTFFRNVGGGCSSSTRPSAPVSMRRAVPGPASAMRLSMRTTMADSTCSWPTGTSTTGPGPTARWPSRPSSSGGGIAGASNWPRRRSPRPILPAGLSDGALRPATWITMGESTW